MDSEVKRLTSKVQELEVQVAARKPIEDLVKIFVYFLVALSIVVGLFGIKQFSDLREIVSAEVKLQYPRDQQSFLEYKRLIEETAKLNTDFQRLHGKYGDALKGFANLDKVTDDFDIEGKVQRIMIESTERIERDDGSLMDEDWRLGAISMLRVLEVAQKERNFDSDFIFNAAQSASRLQQIELAYELMKTAYEKRPGDAPIKAGMLSGIVDIGTESESNEAFMELMEMVKALTPNSPHIVLAEAWNAAEERRRYKEFIAALDELLSKDDAFKPSFAYFMKAHAHLRSSQEGDIELAKQTLRNGMDTMLHETSESV